MIIPNIIESKREDRIFWLRLMASESIEIV